MFSALQSTSHPVTDVENSVQIYPWLQCEVCDAWFHAIRAGVKKEIFDACKQMDNLHWICEKCNLAATRTLKMMTKM